jgi:hypothetical protein
VIFKLGGKGFHPVGVGIPAAAEGGLQTNVEAAMTCEQLREEPAKKTLDRYRRKVGSVPNRSRSNFDAKSGANLGPIRIPLCSKLL